MGTFGALMGSLIAGLAYNLSGRNYAVTFSLSALPALGALLLVTTVSLTSACFWGGRLGMGACLRLGMFLSTNTAAGAVCASMPSSLPVLSGLICYFWVPLALCLPTGLSIALSTALSTSLSKCPVYCPFYCPVYFPFSCPAYCPFCLLSCRQY